MHRVAVRAVAGAQRRVIGCSARGAAAWSRKCGFSTSSTADDDSFDVVIMGGGVMGSSAAFHIASMDPTVRVAVVERDQTYEQASCVLSAGGMRMQFSNAENVEMCMYSGEFLRNLREHLALEVKPGESDDDVNEHVDVQFQQNGYLFLTDSPSGKQVLHENCDLQRSFGAKTVALEPSELAERYPWMEVSDLAAGSVGLEYEGWFDPWSLLQSLRRKAKQLGVTFVDAQVVGMDTEARDGVSRIDAVHVKGRGDSGVRKLACGQAVNACGAWSRPVAAMAGVPDWPVFPRLRSLFVIHVPAATFPDVPFTINPDGTYMRREGPPQNGRFACGVSPAEDDDPDFAPEFNVPQQLVREDLFYDLVWPGLAARCPVFEEAKLVGSWAGFYDFNPFDHNAIIGKDRHCDNMVLVSGFSGHGLMQAPAAGRAVAELALFDTFQTIDLSRMTPNRFRQGNLLKERNII